ncbi:MAG: hypothetical protein Q8P59_13310 [Dehalococcoidia bacterium]|nr:hypothetical protein [Dehalococcoidia bacterium]
MASKLAERAVISGGEEEGAHLSVLKANLKIRKDGSHNELAICPVYTDGDGNTGHRHRRRERLGLDPYLIKG